MKSRLALTLTLLAFSPLAAAHPLHMNGAGFVAGLLHPFSGLDHLLAMFAVGLWAAQLGGRALWAVPAAFVGMMIAGGALGMTGIALPFTDTFIVASVLALGLLISFAVRLPTLLGMLLVGLFALFHGHAHGTELPQAASAGGYAFGFVLTTLVLHGAGMLAALGLSHMTAQRLVRAGGGLIALAGMFLLYGS